MARAYSMNLRQRAMDRLAAGETSYAVAEALKVAASSVIKWAQRQRTTNSVEPGVMGGHRRPKIAGADRDWALGQVERTPHVTLAALAAGLAARGLKLRPASLGRLLHREGKSLQENRSPRRTGKAEAGPPA